MALRPNLIACSTAGFTCSGLIFENCGNDEDSSKGFDIKSYILLKGYINHVVLFVLKFKSKTFSSAIFYWNNDLTNLVDYDNRIYFLE